MTWSAKIKELRYKLCLTQEEFATVLGISYVSVNRYENGKSIPTMKVKRKLIKYFKENNVEMEEF